MTAVTIRCEVQVPERWEQCKKQDHNSEFQNRLCLVQRPAWKNPRGRDLGEKRGPGELVDFQDHFLQEWFILKSRKARKSAWMNEEHLNKPIYKKGRIHELEAESNHPG